MARPVKCRRVDSFPGADYFKPAGIPLRDLEEVSLTIGEAEAIRLKDLEGLEQEEGAERMNISRSTFQRVLSAARQKIADALLNGKAIRIEGGNFELTSKRFRCNNQHEWDVPQTAVESEAPGVCPVCNSTEISPVIPDGPRCGRTENERCCRKNGHLHRVEDR
jgi:uncharacterized protein